MGAHKVAELQHRLALSSAGLPRVAGTVMSIILCVKNMSSSDVLVTENITLTVHS